jgi:hypothetical protein
VEELLQKHRTFTLSVAVGGFVFLLAILIRGCAVYDLNLDTAHASLERKAKELDKARVPDDKYLRQMDAVVAAADARVAELAVEVGRTEKGERLWEECIGDVLRTVGQDTPEKRRDIMGRARRLPSAAFSLLLEEVRSGFAPRASQNDVEIVQADLGFEQVQEAGFARSLAALAAVCRVVGKAIDLGVTKVEGISPSGTVTGIGGTENAPFVNSIIIRFKVRGEPADLAELIRSVNDRDRDGRGRRLVLDEVYTVGRPEGVKSLDQGIAEFSIRVFLVNLEAEQ